MSPPPSSCRCQHGNLQCKSDHDARRGQMPHLRLYNKTRIPYQRSKARGSGPAAPPRLHLAPFPSPSVFASLSFWISLWLYFSTLFISSGALALIYNNLFIHLTVHFLSPPLGIIHPVGLVHPALPHSQSLRSMYRSLNEGVNDGSKGRC